MSLSAQISIESKSDHICGRFHSMASPCEILVDSQDVRLATEPNGLKINLVAINKITLWRRSIIVKVSPATLMMRLINY